MTGILLDGWSFLESPRWHDGRVWVSDFYTRKVLAVGLDGGVEEITSVPGQPSGLGWLPDGDLLVVSMKDRAVLRLRNGSLRLHAALSPYTAGSANDMVVDRWGRAYVGNFGFDLMSGARPQPTCLVRVDPDGTVTRAAEELWFPNGCVLTPDGSTLIVAETFRARLTAFDVAADGSLSRRREWAPLRPGGRPCSPDGIALDAEGCIWVADATGARAIRVREGGEILAEVTADGYGVFACTLAGEDGRTLVLCAAPSFLEQEASRTRHARLVTHRLPFRHAGRL